MPQFDTSYFIPQLFWMGMCFLILVLIVNKLLLPKIESGLFKRQHEVDLTLQQQQKLLLEIENIKADNDQRIEAAKLKVREDIENLTEALQEDLHRTIARLDHVYGQEYQTIQRQHEEALKSMDLEPMVFKIATMVVKKIEKRTSSADDKKKIQQFVKKALISK